MPMTPSRFKQPCTECRTLSNGPRCPIHQSAYDTARAARTGRPRPERQARKSELYNYQYRIQAKEIKATATHCHLCGRAFLETDTIDADHLVPGDPSSPLAPAHSRCNRSRGNKPLTK